jgi:hypothetical protein
MTNVINQDAFFYWKDFYSKQTNNLVFYLLVPKFNEQKNHHFFEQWF